MILNTKEFEIAEPTQTDIPKFSLNREQRRKRSKKGQRKRDKYFWKEVSLRKSKKYRENL